MKLDDKIQNLPGVGPKMAERLERLGIKNIRDLLFYYPRRYDDFSHPQMISQLRIGDDAIVAAKIISIKKSYTRRRWMTLIEAELSDSSGVIKAVWFNQPFIINIIKPGDTWLFAGKVQWDFKGRTKTIAVSQYESESKILPVYPETAGITSKYLRKLLKPLLHTPGVCKMVEEYLPEEILKSEKLIGLNDAILKIHMPESLSDIEQAKKRLAFDELFFISLRMQLNKQELSKSRGIALVFDEKLMQDFVKSLPFKLTNSQRRTAWEIICDLQKATPMNRMLLGDVGSGKTVVAAMAAVVTAQNHLQSVWLAPTEILANQHYQTVSKFLKPFKIKVGLWTAADKKSELQKDDLIIGTHALIQKGIAFKKLGLIIVDEQHRFGVKQRARLRQGYDGQAVPLTPHFLSMTATPIPRTLALAVYGDLDLSIISELPSGRQKIITKVILPDGRQSAYDFIKKEIRKGRQAFVICPLIEEKKLASEDNQLFLVDDRKSAVKEYEKLSTKVFAKLKIGLIHGKMKSKDKNETMDKFKNHQLDILVATAVIEVGIDITNATVMMIEGAERFGLAQLHQFRGRVGRGEHQSYCLLFSESESTISKKRLEAMVKSNDGFELAQIDLELRGPGEIAGLRQSGLPDLKMASITDKIMIERTNIAAAEIIKSGIDKYPMLKEKMEENENSNHPE